MKQNTAPIYNQPTQFIKMQDCNNLINVKQNNTHQDDWDQIFINVINVQNISLYTC